jgi:Tol biopolymer transport system component
MAFAAALIPIVMASGLWYASSTGMANAPVLSAPFAVEKISADGNVLHAVISHDGQNVVYTHGFEGKQSIWLKQLASSSNTQILAPDDYFYYGLALSPDGSMLYFNRRPKLIERQGDIYQVAIFGGVPVKIVSETQGPISISPDGLKMSFVRCHNRVDDNCSLWIADAPGGTNERKLVTRPRPSRIGDHEFSPSGRSITFAVGQSQTQASEFGLSEVDIDSGTEREVTSQKFFNIKSIAWLPDESGLLLTASRVPDKTFHIWRVTPGAGDAERLTNDAASYATLSMDGAASMLIATQVRQNFGLQVHGMSGPAAMQVLADGTSVTYAGAGRIVFSSARTGNHEIWSMNADGSDQRQLTNNIAEDRTSAVSPDNNFIFFESNRSGGSQVWRMNADGTDQTQITYGEGGFPIFVSADGKWLYYSSALKKTLKRVPTTGGDEEVVMDKPRNWYAVSPDRVMVAMTEKRGDTVVLLVVSLEDKNTIHTFPLPASTNPWVDLAWTPDGQSIAFITRNSEMQDNKVWLQPLTGAQPQLIANLGNKEISELSGFAMSPDGTSFAVSRGRWEHDAVLVKGLR